MTVPNDNPIQSILQDTLGVNRSYNTVIDRLENALRRPLTVHERSSTKLLKQLDAVLGSREIDINKLDYVGPGQKSHLGAETIWSKGSRRFSVLEKANLDERVFGHISGKQYLTSDPNYIVQEMMSKTSTRGLLNLGEGAVRGAAYIDGRSILDAGLGLDDPIYQGSKTTVRQIVDGGLFFRGQYNPVYGLSQSYGMYSASSVGLRKAKSIASRARGALNILTSAGMYGDELTTLKGMSQVDAFDVLTAQLNAYPEVFSGHLKDVARFLPYIKPDTFVDSSPEVLLPNAKLLGRNFVQWRRTTREMEKGLFQVKNLMHTDAFRLPKLGLSAIPRYISGAMATDLRRGLASDVDIFRGQQLNIAVAQFADVNIEQAAVQDSGMLLSHRGAHQFRRRLHTGRMTIDLPSPEFADTIGAAFGIDLSQKRGFIQDPTLLPFSRSRIKRLMSDKVDVSKLSKQDAAMREFLLSKQGGKYKGLLKAMLRVDSSTGGAQVGLSAFEYRQGQVLLDFTTVNAKLPQAEELILSSMRMTGVRPLASNPYAAALNALTGYHGLISSTDFAKMNPQEVLMNNMLAQLEKRGMLGQALSAAQIQTTSVRNGGVSRQVAVIEDGNAAFTRLLSHVRGDSRYASFLDEMLYGEKLSLKGMPGVKALRGFAMAGGVRADFGGDINTMGPNRITVGKMATLAQRAKHLGYALKDDVIFQTFYEPWSKQARAAFDPNTLALKLGESNQFVRTAKGLMGDASVINQHKNVISIVKGRLHYGGTPLKALPHVGEFDFTKGVLKEDLKGTILDPKLIDKTGGTAFIDLGKVMEFDIAGHKYKTQYAPIPLKALRSDKLVFGRLNATTSDPLARIISGVNLLEGTTEAPEWIMQKGHPAAPSGGTMGTFGRIYSEGMGMVIKRMAGKDGLIDKDLTMVLKGVGARARLIPQRGRAYTTGDLLDQRSIFKDRINEYQLLDYLERNESINPTGVRRIRKILKEKKKLYAMTMVDPAQRPEHMLLSEVELYKGPKSGAKTGILDIATHPFRFLMTERDTDRDVINILFPQAMNEKISDAQFEEQIRRQAERSKYALHWAGYLNKYLQDPDELGKSGFKKMMSKFANLSDLPNYMATYISQKATASYGYTLTRAFDEINRAVAFGDESFKFIKGDYGRELAAQYRKVVSEESMSAATSLFQALYQKGVKKAGSGAGLYDIGRTLVGIREDAAAKGLSISQIQSRASDSIYDALMGKLPTEASARTKAILKSMSDSRMFMNMGHVMDQLQWDQASKNAMLSDLRRGAAGQLTEEGNKRLAAQADTMMRKMSDIMGLHAGVGFALRGAVTSMAQVGDAIRFVQKAGLADHDRSFNNLIRPLATNQATDFGVVSDETISIAEKEMAKALDKAGLLKKRMHSLTDFVKSKHGALGLGVVAGIGATLIYGRMSEEIAPQGAPLPMPMMTDQPSDINPAMAPSPRIYTSQAQIPMRMPSYNDTQISNTYSNPFGIASYSSTETLSNRYSTDAYLQQQEARSSLFSDF